MVSVKPVLNREAVIRLLRDDLGIEFQDLKEIRKGQIARTYALDVGGRPCILQFTAPNMSQGCRNERLFAEEFRRLGIPVRHLLHEGDFAGLHYTLALQMPGVGLDQLSPTAFKAVLPSVMALLLKLTRVDTSGTTGYGWLDPQGDGAFASWEAHLRQVREEEPGQFYGRWHKLFESTFLDRGIFDRYFEKMVLLIDQTPSRRELVHGGFGYGNLLVKDGQITGVLDWQDARYGDHVFDLAYMINWLDDELRDASLRCYRSTLEQAEAGFSEAYLDQRIQCYLTYIGIDSLRFAAKTENESFYRAVLERLASVDEMG